METISSLTIAFDSSIYFILFDVGGRSFIN